jgi:hypothetical protein
MARLVNPGIGDLCDRLTILALKILYGSEGGKDTQHWEAERASLLAQVRSRELNGPWFEGLLELAAVNACLWQTEDDLRAMRLMTEHAYTAGDLDRIRQIAFRTQVLNDRRAELVHAISKAAGDERGQEKLR